VNAAGWSRGLEVTGGGTGVVSHPGLVLLRQLADRAGLTAGLSAALPSPLGGHDRGRVLADLACAIHRAPGQGTGGSELQGLRPPPAAVTPASDSHQAR